MSGASGLYLANDLPAALFGFISQIGDSYISTNLRLCYDST